MRARRTPPSKRWRAPWDWAAQFAQRFEGPEPLSALAEFRTAIGKLDPLVESALWEKVTEALEEEYELAEEMAQDS